MATSTRLESLPFPPLSLPIRPPFPPMEAELVRSIPEGDWMYEPKWDGFRCLAFKDRSHIELQSKSGRPLTRYFPELVQQLARVRASRLVVDGEIVIIREGHLSFDDLLQRIHPAATRILKLSARTPVSFFLFDLLVDPRGKAIVELPLRERRERLEAFFGSVRNLPELCLSPVRRDRATAAAWMKDLGTFGCDGIMAKDPEADYRSGERTGMVKVKRMLTADCVVGGFRYDQNGREIGSLLLGLYDENGKLNHVGYTSSFSVKARKELRALVLPLRGKPGFSGKAPGGPSRWSTKHSAEWEPLRPELVCEVRYDHYSGGRFRHGTTFLRWRPDKAPSACTLKQLTGGVLGAPVLSGEPPAALKTGNKFRQRRIAGGLDEI